MPDVYTRQIRLFKICNTNKLKVKMCSIGATNESVHTEPYGLLINKINIKVAISNALKKFNIQSVNGNDFISFQVIQGLI